MPAYDLNEADTCEQYITPKLIKAGWGNQPHSYSREKTFTDGRIVVSNNVAKRGKGKRADYILRYRRDYPIAVIEAKKISLPANVGLQQAKEYAQILGLQFAYASNGTEIIEYDFTTGRQTQRDDYPTPDELWTRLKASEGIDEEAEKHVLEASRYEGNRRPRYYQEIAINRTVQNVVQGNKRILLTMATGTGKTFTAFQICWKLWNSRWNRAGDGHRRPRILFLADRNILVDDPKDKDFAVFGDARHKIQGGDIVKSREMYFAIYQAIAQDEKRPGLFRKFTPTFFDLIIIDECHRGSARTDSNWREILEYFEPAYQLGLTATPRRDDNIDTYNYFGDPIYQYSLKQGIEDGFLAPYTVHRITTNYDVHGWRPEEGQLDRYGREIPDEEYTTADFERVIALKARTQAIARHLAAFMRETGRMSKTIVFCVDQEHAGDMLGALNNLNDDLTKQNPDYIVQITSNTGDTGRANLSRFQDPENNQHIIATTSQLLTTGVDIPTCQNVVLARVVNSMTDFKQIIGRGTRVRDEYGKLFFNILDYTGSATKLFADPDFDGFPALIREVVIDEYGDTTEAETIEDQDPTAPDIDEDDIQPPDISDRELHRRKFYVDDGEVEIVGHMVSELDPEGYRLRTVKYTDYTAEKVRTLYRNSADMRRDWADPENRDQMIVKLNEKGIVFELLAEITNQREADPFDLLCHVAFNAPIRTRRERATRIHLEEKAFFDQYSETARNILYELLEKYADYGVNQFELPDILQVSPLTEYGNVREIVAHFGSPEALRRAVDELQNLLYAA